MCLCVFSHDVNYWVSPQVVLERAGGVQLALDAMRAHPDVSNINVWGVAMLKCLVGIPACAVRMLGMRACARARARVCVCVCVCVCVYRWRSVLSAFPFTPFHPLPT